ncbi:hypothetical protein QUB70_15950 [Microcoleus sp. A003_D6]|uniref:hypothetical protein n=1 Tax=Microcoleus sp. A003_D6 TaxID=3055266 RepID=UPI002FD30C55
MTQPNILELAKQGDAKAIALLLNRQLQGKGITAAASLKDGCLQVMLEATEAPSQQVLAPWVSKSIAGLGAASIEKVKVYGRQTGAKVPAWSQEFEVAGQKLPVTDVTEVRASSSENTESNQLSLKERAKLGDVEAIASLLNLPLQNKGISATASLQDGCLQVMLEGERVPDEEVSIRIVRRELTNLKAGAIIASVKVYGQQAGEDLPAWNQEFEIVAQAQTIQQNNNVKLNNHHNTIGDFNIVRAIFLAFFMIFMFLVFINNWLLAIIILILGGYVVTKLPGQPLANFQSIGKLLGSNDLVKEAKSKFNITTESSTTIKQKKVTQSTQKLIADGFQEIARNGDLGAVAILIQQSLAAYEVHVDAEMQYGVMLWLKLKSDITLDSQTCLNVVARILNNIQLQKFVLVRISQVNSKNPKKQAWNKYLVFKEGQFIDNTKAVNQMTGAFGAAVVVVLLFVSVMYKPTSTTSPSVVSSSSTSGSTAPRTFLGKSKTGYELWAYKNCVYVKGLTEGDLARLNTDISGFKDAVKAETGYKCVLFE